MIPDIHTRENGSCIIPYIYGVGMLYGCNIMDSANTFTDCFATTTTNSGVFSPLFYDNIIEELLKVNTCILLAN